MLLLAAIGWNAQAKGRNPFVAIIKAIILWWIAIIVFVFIFTATHNRQSDSTPALAAVPNTAPVPERGPEPPIPTVQPADQEWILVSDAYVTERPIGGIAPIARVHAGRPIHVLGTVTTGDGEFLKIVMHNGFFGFVPAASAQYKANWLYRNG
jgi:hypothetical protein